MPEHPRTGYMREYRASRREKVRSYNREYNKQWRKKHGYGLIKSYNKRYPEKVRARYAVDNAIRRGKLKKLPCEKCGDPKSQAHHPDYSKKLEVVWLCALHHKEQHLKE